MKKLLFLLTVLSPILFANDTGKIRYELLDYSDNEYDYANIPNKDPICKAYVDALNKYPPVVDFFVAPLQPNSPEFGYPKWEQLDLVEYEKLFFIMEDYGGVTNKTYLNVNEIKRWQQLSDKIEKFKRLWQLYYTVADIDNDGEQEAIVKEDQNRYTAYPDRYTTLLVAFKLAKPKELSVVKNQISRVFQKETFVYDLLFYKGKTYIKRTKLDTDKIMLKAFNQNKELVNLCYIRGGMKNDK